MSAEKEIFKWSENLATGISWQDKQHQTLIKQINKIFNQTSEVTEALEFAKLYAATHFRDEEAVMIHYSYPQSTEHIQEHDYFIDTIQSLDPKTQDDEEIRKDILFHLSSWLMGHIIGSDAHQATWFKGNSDIMDHQPSEFYTELEAYRLSKKG